MTFGKDALLPQKYEILKKRRQKLSERVRKYMFLYWFQLHFRYFPKLKRHDLEMITISNQLVGDRHV